MTTHLDARPIAGPLHMFDCVMPCAGAEAFLVMSVDRAKSLGLPWVKIRAADELHNAYSDQDPIQYRAGWKKFAPAMYERAGTGPEDMDLLYTYDDYPVISMMQMEDLGFCKKGKAAEFTDANPLTWDGGGLVHNSSGGQLSCGQAGSAAGYMGVVEAFAPADRHRPRPAGIGRPPRHRQRLRHDQLRPRPVRHRRRAGNGREIMTIKLPVCTSCGKTQYPVREICGECLSDQLEWLDIRAEGELIASVPLYHSPGGILSGPPALDHRFGSGLKTAP